MTKRLATLVMGLFLLSGCALPPALQVASWAIDGISYLATQKSATDHGLSVLAQKDCSVLRMLSDPKEVCRDFDDSAIQLADGMAYGQLFKENEFLSAEADPLAEFEPVGGGNVIVEPKVGPAGLLQSKLALLNDNDGLGPYGGGDVVKPKAKIVLATKNMGTKSEPLAGYYTVIGSFKNHANARKLRNLHRVLAPSVLSAKLNTTVLYRVVLGPFSKNDEKSIKTNISRAGIADTWTIKVKPGDWSMAVLELPTLTSVEVATAQGSLNLRNSNIKGFTQISSN